MNVRKNPYTRDARQDLHDLLTIVKMPKKLWRPIELAALLFDLEIDDIAKALRGQKRDYGNALKLLEHLDLMMFSHSFAADIDTAGEDFADLDMIKMAKKLLDHYHIDHDGSAEHIGVLFANEPFRLAMLARSKDADVVPYVLAGFSELTLDIDGEEYEPREAMLELYRRHQKRPFNPRSR